MTNSNHGGRRDGAGRKPGSVTKRTREIADAAAAEGITPLEFMLNVMRDEVMSAAIRFEAAKAAAPYIHPKLASVEHKGDPDNPLQTVSRIEIVPLRGNDDSAD